MTKTTAKTWQNSYLITGNPKTIKNSKSTLNVLRVFQCDIEKLTKVKKRIIQKRRASPNAYIGGYCECYTEWGGEDDHLRKRLELAGIRRLFFPEARLIHREDYSLRTVSRNEQRAQIPWEILSEIHLPIYIRANEGNWGYDFDTIIYDWKDHPFAKQQCRKYLLTLKQFEIVSDEVFEKSYPLIALIPTYNESELIRDCLQNVEKYCDGIIMLDDDSQDNTFQIAQSEKILVKAKKIRTEFDDKQNRNILLNIASFFNAEWFIFIDVDERFDKRFVDLRVVMTLPVDIVGVWIVNLWNSDNTYRVDMEDTNPYSHDGLWLRWRMFRNKGRMQIINQKKLHFSSVPYMKNICISRTLLLHLGYINVLKRDYKRCFYVVENDKNVDIYYKKESNNVCLKDLQGIVLNIE